MKFMKEQGMSMPQQQSTPPGWYAASEGPFERWWDGYQWTADVRPLGLAHAPRRRTASPLMALISWILAACGALTFIGAFLPWATLGIFSVAGTDGDGILTLVAGLLAIGAGVALAVAPIPPPRQTAIAGAAVLVGLGVLLVGVYDATSIAEEASVGSGLVLTILAGLGVTAAAVLATLLAASSLRTQPKRV